MPGISRHCLNLVNTQPLCNTHTLPLLPVFFFNLPSAKKAGFLIRDWRLSSIRPGQPQLSVVWLVSIGRVYEHEKSDEANFQRDFNGLPGWREQSKQYPENTILFISSIQSRRKKNSIVETNLICEAAKLKQIRLKIQK